MDVGTIPVVDKQCRTESPMCLCESGRDSTGKKFIYFLDGKDSVIRISRRRRYELAGLGEPNPPTTPRPRRLRGGCPDDGDQGKGLPRWPPIPKGRRDRNGRYRCRRRLDAIFYGSSRTGRVGRITRPE